MTLFICRCLSRSLIELIADRYKDSTGFIILGKNISYPVALEGALKLNELTYLGCMGFPSAELKHGPIALIDKTRPVIILAPKDSFKDKIINAIHEVKARNGIVILISSYPKGDSVEGLADHVVRVPDTHQLLSPIMMAIPLQLFAYYLAVS